MYENELWARDVHQRRNKKKKTRARYYHLGQTSPFPLLASLDPVCCPSTI
jgi:hypothetical protein